MTHSCELLPICPDGTHESPSFPADRLASRADG